MCIINRGGQPADPLLPVRESPPEFPVGLLLKLYHKCILQTKVEDERSCGTVPATTTSPRYNHISLYVFPSGESNGPDQPLSVVITEWQRSLQTLRRAMDELVAENEAVADQENEYGAFYQAVGDLHGPDGILAVVTVWIVQKVDGNVRFITLKPAR